MIKKPKTNKPKCLTVGTISKFNRGIAETEENSIPLTLIYMWPSGPWAEGCWIYNYLSNQGLSPLTLRIRTPLRRGALHTPLCDKDCQWLAIGRWFSHVSSTGARGTDHPPFSNFLFTNLFSIKFLYLFIISSLFPYFNLFVSIFIQSYVNINIACVNHIYVY